MVHSSAELELAKPGNGLSFCSGLICNPALLFAPSCSLLQMSAAIASAAGAGAVDMYGVRQLMRVLAAALAAVIAAPAGAQTGIKFTLDGPVEGPEALFLLPRDKGYFKSEGLDVVIDEASSP